MTLGREIAKELRRRGEAGYFTFGQYQALYRVDDGEELKQFMAANEMPVPEEVTDAKAFVDFLQTADRVWPGAGGGLGAKLLIFGLAIVDCLLMQIPSMFWGLVRPQRMGHFWFTEREMRNVEARNERTTTSFDRSRADDPGA